MFLYSPYMLITILSSFVILVMGICMLVTSIPPDAKLRNYRMARFFLAGAYIALGTVGLWEILGEMGSESQLPVMAFTLIVASFQALLFTFSIITLINMQYMTRRRVWGNLVPIFLLSCGLLVILFVVPQYFYFVFYVALVLYCLQLIYYVAVFQCEYKEYCGRFDDFFSNQDHRRLLWIRTSFYMAATVGIMAVTSLFVSVQIYTVFTVTYTIFYIYFSVKFSNYLTLFHYIAPVVVPEEESVSGNDMVDIRFGLTKWIERKEYIHPDVTLQGLARELNTNSKYLSRYINIEYKQNFRSWINSLRIGESMRLIESGDYLLLDEISEKTGISSRSTFYRQFVTITGMTPAEYRRKVKGDSFLE